MMQIIWNSIVDHIPLWGWVVIIGAPILALLYFFYPILLPIWKMLPTWLKAVLIGIVGGFLAYMGGRERGRRNAEDEQKNRDANAIKTRERVDTDVSNLSDTQTQDKLRDRWSRD